MPLLQAATHGITAGIQKKRGNNFGLGNYDAESTYNLSVSESLDLVQINNMDCERAVFSINCELKIRGEKQLASSS